MAIDTEVLGDQLAVDVAEQARAREEIARTRPGSPIRDISPVLIIIPVVVIFMPLDGENLRWLATVLAIVFVGALIELRRLSRRLEAVLTLIESQSGHHR